jgi:3-phenylpropionate/trans-cinnamate dioxygenase ferredoxin reductase component
MPPTFVIVGASLAGGVAAATLRQDGFDGANAGHWFWSDQNDVNLQYAGFHQEWDRIVVRGNLESRDFLAFYLTQERIGAVVGLNRGKDVRRVMPSIRARVAVDARQLADEGVELRSLVRASSARA